MDFIETFLLRLLELRNKSQLNLAMISPYLLPPAFGNRKGETKTRRGLRYLPGYLLFFVIFCPLALPMDPAVFLYFLFDSRTLGQ